jgi:hypothetical protein
VVAGHARHVGELSDREVLSAAAVAYCCEGSKDKPYRRKEESFSSTVIPL